MSENFFKNSVPRIAIIGAGLSGLVAAGRLKDFAEIEIFEKSRGVGGRMASRQVLINENSSCSAAEVENKNVLCFDFGAQFFNAKSKEFKEFLQPFVDEGLVVEWRAKFVEIDGNKILHSRLWDGKPEHYVVNPKMNALCKKISAGLNVNLQTKIVRTKFNQQSVELFDDKGENRGEFDFVISAIPAFQALDLIPKNHPFCLKIAAKKMVGCFTVMLGLEEDLPVDWEVAYLKNSKLSWIAKEGSKPNRKGSKAITFLSRNAWAEKNLDRDLLEVKEELLTEFAYAVNCPLPKIIHSDIHRWLYANIEKQGSDETFLLDLQNRIGICGDWLVRGRVEAAFKSGNNLACEIIKKLNF